MSGPHTIVGCAAAAVAAVALAIEGSAAHSNHSSSWPGSWDTTSGAPTAWQSEPTPEGPVIVEANPTRALPESAEHAIVERARREVEGKVRYDSSFQLLPTYPNGDIPADRGACTDVVIRALRAVSVDLQRLVHEDVQSSPEVYGHAPNWHLDHRRVSTLHTYFTRHALALETDFRAKATFRPGDVVFFAWKKCPPTTSPWPCLPEHVAVVSDRIGPRGFPLLIQNGGPFATESDGLDHGSIVGHFRLNHVYYALK